MALSTKNWCALFLASWTFGCGAGVPSVDSGGESDSAAPSPSGSGSTEPTPEPAPEAARYDGKGFVVHEWGTDTVVVGSNGSLQRGLHHEEEDLPSFVYDRIKAGSLPASTSVEVKMETPVTYFYSAEPLDAKVSVGFPAGVFTQWYPAVSSFYPMIAGPASTSDLEDYGDPALDPTFPFATPECQAKPRIANGLLDWGTVKVLGRGESRKMPEAALDRYTWSFAREVEANRLEIAGAPGTEKRAEAEHFLFYRGLGRFDLPVEVRALGAGAIEAENRFDTAMGTVFVLNVDGKSGAFKAHDGGIAAHGTLATGIPSLEGASPMAEFVEELGDRVTRALDATGLYHDESTAMVNTWKRQWFRTPGIRLLYLAPQAWTDASIPLTIEPKPDRTTRVMMIRVEVITPELEDTDVAATALLQSASTEASGMDHFTRLGRFAEPRLRRALQKLGHPKYAEPFLASVTSADTTTAAGE